MINVVPVASVSIVIAIKPTPGLRTRDPVPVTWFCSQYAMPNDWTEQSTTVR